MVPEMDNEFLEVDDIFSYVQSLGNHPRRAFL